jgi:hypothetical protein
MPSQRDGSARRSQRSAKPSGRPVGKPLGIAGADELQIVHYLDGYRVEILEM